MFRSDVKAIEPNDIEVIIKEVQANFCEVLPQLNYAGFSLYSILIPEILSAMKTSLVLPQPQGVGASWNIADAVLQIIAGSMQIHSAVQGDTYKPIATGIEGAINVGSGTQLITLTLISASLGAIGFAAAFGVISAISLKNTIDSAALYINEHYWFQDTLDRLDFLSNHNTPEEKETNLANLREMIYTAYLNNESFPQDTVNLISIVAIEFLSNRLKEEKNNFDTLQKNLFNRLIVNYVEQGEKSYLINEITTNHLKNLTPDQKSCLNEIKNNNKLIESKNQLNSIEDRSRYTNVILNKFALSNYETIHQSSNQVKQKLKEETLSKAIDTLFILSAFAGMLCLCVPGGQPLAPLFITPAACYFVGKYTDKGVSLAQSTYSFFNNIKIKLDCNKIESAKTTGHVAVIS